MTGYKEYIPGLSQDEIFNLIESFFIDHAFLDLVGDEKVKRVNETMSTFRNLTEGGQHLLSLKVHESTFEHTDQVFVCVGRTRYERHSGSILSGDKLKSYLRNRSLDNLLSP